MASRWDCNNGDGEDENGDLYMIFLGIDVRQSEILLRCESEVHLELVGKTILILIGDRLSCIYYQERVIFVIFILIFISL